MACNCSIGRLPRSDLDEYLTAGCPDHDPELVRARENAEYVREVQAQLLMSEGIDPTWPGFD